MPSAADMGSILDHCKFATANNRKNIIDDMLLMDLDRDALMTDEDYELLAFLNREPELSENLTIIKREILRLYDFYGLDVIYHGTIPRPNGWAVYSDFRPLGHGLPSAADTARHRLISTRDSDAGSRYAIYLESFSADGNFLRS